MVNACLKNISEEDYKEIKGSIITRVLCVENDKETIVNHKHTNPSDEKIRIINEFYKLNPHWQKGEELLCVASKPISAFKNIIVALLTKALFNAK